MADSKTFVLVGNFQDNITPALEKINSSIDKLKRNLGKASYSGGFDDLTKSLGKVVSAHKHLNSEVTELRNNLSKSIPVLREYRKEAGKAISANIGLGRRKSAGLAAKEIQSWERATRALNNYNNALSRSGGRRAPIPAAAAPATRRGRSYAEGGYTSAVAGGVAGGVIGGQLEGVITNAIVGGFQIGVNLMRAPFEYFANALGERVRDEMSDIKAAGGYFSIAKRQDQPFVKTFDQALDFTQKNNAVLAKLAASLPGSTQDYIEVSKRIGDSVARTVMKDKSAAIAYANELRKEFPTTYGGQLQGSGVEAQRGAITTLLGELTKKTVLAGQGGRSGAGGAIGPYGLPGLTERMLSQDEVSMGQFQRYSAIFSDPMIMDALQREIPKINATAKNSIERFKALQKFYDDVLPPEMIEKYRRSIAGLQEAFNTAIMGPETGLFGLGRKMKGLGKKINDFGQFVDQFGNVVTDVNMAAEVDLSVFDMLRDILANTAQVLLPIIENITMLWDPLRKIGLNLKDARHFTANFLKSFNQYRGGIEQYAKLLGKGAGAKLLETKDLRASFATLANLFKQLGVFDSAEFKSISKKILDPNANLGSILKGMVDTFLNSDAAFKVGEFIGNLVGTVLSETAKAMGVVTGMATGGPLAKGLVSGFEAAGGSAAFASIIQNTFSLLGKLLLEVVKAAPLQTAVLGALMLLPAAISGLISAAITSCTSKLQGIGGCPLPGTGGGGGRGGRGGRGLTPDMPGYGNYRGRPRRYGPGGSLDRLARMRRYKMGQIAQFGTEAAGLGYNIAGRPGAGMARGIGGMLKGAGRLARGIPGGALASGAIDLGVSLATGENFGKAAVGAFGTVLGGAAGSIFGPVGTVIGSMAGGALADASYNFIAKAFEKPNLEQIKAAGMQLQAASFNKQRADMQEGGVVGTNLFGTFKELSQRLEILNIKGKEAERIKGEYAYREELTKRAKEDAKALKEAVDAMVTAGLDPEVIAEATKELKVKSDKSAKELEESNRRLQIAFNKLPDTAERALYMSLSQMSTAGISAMFAQKIGQIPIPSSPFSLPTTLDPSNPYSPNYKPNSPLLQPGGGFQWGPSTSSPTGGIFDNIDWSKKPTRFAGGLGDAVAAELKNKPPGSKLLIANSSETVIPAAGGSAGAGMLDFVETLRSGFYAMVRAVTDAKQQQQSSLNKINQTLVVNQQQTNLRLSKLESKFSAPGLGGAMPSGGGVDAFNPIAGRYGLTLTSGYRPGDPGWHGANRARDYSNSTGPTLQMLQFAQFMASTYGRNLKELIYTPLGFSIKNGQRVAPYAQAGHYNHVHVAYANGFGNPPAVFGRASDAQRWEKQHLGAGVKTITTNTAELGGLIAELRYGQTGLGKKPGGGQANWMQILEQDYLKNLNKPVPGGPSRNSGRGGLDMWEGPGSAYMSPNGMYSGRGSAVASAPINVNAPITINQQPGQDSKKLASEVAMHISMAIQEVRRSTG